MNLMMQANNKPMMNISSIANEPMQGLQALDTHGYLVLENAMDREILVKAQQALDDIAATERKNGNAILEDGQSANGKYNHNGPYLNQRIVSLLFKHDVFIALALHDEINLLLQRCFGSSYGVDQSMIDQYSLDELLLSSVTANIVNFGAKPMFLHKDQGALPLTPYPVLYNVIYLLDDFCEGNGATRVVPKSHKTQDKIYSDTDGQAITAPAGSALILDGRLVHGTGANITKQPRRAVLYTYCRPFLRTFENYFASLDKETFDRLPTKLQAMLGFKVWMLMGSVEGYRNGEMIKPKNWLQV